MRFARCRPSPCGAPASSAASPSRAPATAAVMTAEKKPFAEGTLPGAPHDRRARSLFAGAATLVVQWGWRRDRSGPRTMLRARQGDVDAFRVLVEMFSRPGDARDGVRLALRPVTMAEDLCQEVFCACWGLPRFDGQGRFVGWLHHRDERRDPPVTSGATRSAMRHAIVDAPIAGADDLCHHQPRAARSRSANARATPVPRARARRCDAAVTADEFRAAVVLRDMESLSCEIGAALGLAPGIAFAHPPRDGCCCRRCCRVSTNERAQARRRRTVVRLGRRLHDCARTRRFDRRLRVNASPPGPRRLRAHGGGAARSAAKRRRRLRRWPIG